MSALIGASDSKALPVIFFVRTRQFLLAAAGTSACIYALAVLLHVYKLPDLGIRSAFDTSIRRFDGECLPDASGATRLPETGDTVLRLGGREIHTWPQLLQATRAFREAQFVPVQNLNEADAHNLQTIHYEGSDYARLAFLRGQGTNAQVQETWCRVGSMPFEDVVPSLLWFFLKLGLFVVGALVFWKRPTDRSATLFFVLCICTLVAYMGGYHWNRILSQPVLILGFMCAALMLPGVLLHFYCVFPRPKSFLVQPKVGALWIIYGVPTLFLICMIFLYYRTRWLDRNGYSDVDIRSCLGWMLMFINSYLGVASLWYLASVVAQIHSYRTAQDVTEKNQVKWILFGSLAALLPIGSTLYLATLNRNAFGAGAATWPMFAASVCFTAAFIISMTRYRLMDLDQILTSGMIYFLISCLAGLVYVIVVFVATLLTGKGAESSLFQAISVSTTALLVLSLLDIARSRLKKTLDRRLSREKTQLDRTIRRLGQAIDQLVDPTTLARRLLHSSAEVLCVSRASVYLREGEPPIYTLVDAIGPTPPLGELSPGCPLVEDIVPRGSIVGAARVSAMTASQRQLRFLGGEVAHSLVHEGDLLGILILGPKEPNGPFSSEDLTLLEAFAQLTALAIKSAERHRTIESLNRDLQTKVVKISEQQRRITSLQSQLMQQAAPAPQTMPEPKAARPGYIVGSGTAIQLLLQRTQKAALSQSVVLIRGESGTGKELLARYLHEAGSRVGKAFVKVHCAALSPGLLESELFGHVKGAFTGALRDKVGRFELADGGTVFLDEIGDITLDVQTKLLRVLQEMTFERVGSSDPVKVDVRVIAATHQDLETLIKQGKFRQDLYYRLNVISITAPPLRDRREDIAELATHFLHTFAARCGKPVTQIDDDVLSVLKDYPWPGNIRQMENVIERAVVVADDSVIRLEDLPDEILAESETQESSANGSSVVEEDEEFVGVGIHAERYDRDRRERERLVRALSHARGNKAEAARALGLARSTLVSRLKRHGLS